MKYVTIIGSREAPPEALKKIRKIAEDFAALGGYTLRSGGAEGCDSFAEHGWRDYFYHIDAAPSRMEIYIPWKFFNKNTSKLIGACDKAIALAKSLHPAWDRNGEWAKILHARNCYQILGRTLDMPSDLVICWAEPHEKGDGNVKGGTATAVRLALQNNIPVYNLFEGDFVVNTDGTFSFTKFEKTAIAEITLDDDEDIPF